MELLIGAPLSEKYLSAAKTLADECGLLFTEDPEVTVLIIEHGRPVATASLSRFVIKYVAVHPSCRGCGLLEQVMGALVTTAYERGIWQQFLYTKPENQTMFTSCGFYPVVSTDRVLLMENQKNGIDCFLRELDPGKQSPYQTIGSVVMNGDPFTLGHRYLLKQASMQCDVVHLFVLSEDTGAFPAKIRLKMAMLTAQEFSNVRVHPTGPYLISAATFPDYFLKDRADAEQRHAELDIALFLQKIVPYFGIRKRFVGTEPFCTVTASYNQEMQDGFAESPVELCVVDRLEKNGEIVSASRVRQLLQHGRKHDAEELVPESTTVYFRYFNRGSNDGN